MLQYKIGGKSILKNPPQDTNTKFDKDEFERELEELMRKRGITELQAKVTGDEVQNQGNR